MTSGGVLLRTFLRTLDGLTRQSVVGPHSGGVMSHDTARHVV